MIQLINPSVANVNLDNANVQIEPPQAGTIKPFRGDSTVDVVLPAGAYEIFVQHIDPAGGNINVNGQLLKFNGIASFKERFDRPANRQDYCPEVTIVADGTKYALRVEYPSDHPFDPSTL